MEANVIQFPAKKQEKPKSRLDFYCMRCNGPSFRLQADGEIFCDSCGSLMRNLYVSLYPPERP